MSKYIQRCAWRWLPRRLHKRIHRWPLDWLTKLPCEIHGGGRVLFDRPRRRGRTLMGIDAVIYVVGEFTDEELAGANRYLRPRIGYWEWMLRGDPWAPLFRETRTGPRLRVSTTERYYGPGYERGSWPRMALHHNLGRGRTSGATGTPAPKGPVLGSATWLLRFRRLLTTGSRS